MSKNKNKTGTEETIVADSPVPNVLREDFRNLGSRDELSAAESAAIAAQMSTAAAAAAARIEAVPGANGTPIAVRVVKVRYISPRNKSLMVGLPEAIQDVTGITRDHWVVVEGYANGEVRIRKAGAV